MSRVVAIAAPIGGGKTTFAEALSIALGGAAILHYDRYEIETKRPASRLLEWLRDGADFSAFEAPNLARDLKAIRNGEAVADPLTGRRVDPTDLVLLEMPLGREHAETARYIDFVIWIEVPPDIALARKIREYIARFREERDPDGLIWLDNFVANYLQVFREVLLVQAEKVRAGADLVLDGCDTGDALVERAVEAIQDRLSG